MDVFANREAAKKNDAMGGKRWGGIFFSLATLANLAEDALIYPVFGVAERVYEPFLERMRRYPNVDTSGIYQMPGPANEVFLLYEGTDRRVECSKHIAPPIPFEKIQSYLGVDAILVNMISGFDITLETLTAIRMHTQENNALLHLDLHSLTLGIDEENRRFHRPLETWRRWCYHADTVQMNEEEAKVLPLEYLQEEDLIKQILSLGLRGIVFTRGERGATAWKQDHKNISRHDFPAFPVKNIVDPTGCGDVFAAAFCYHLGSHRDPATAAEFANRVAAINVGHVGSDGIDLISQMRKGVEAEK